MNASARAERLRAWIAELEAEDANDQTHVNYWAWVDATKALAALEASAPTKGGHTPGPWLAQEMVSGNWQVADDGTGGTIAHTREGANARLIAAAPEMLEALRALIAATEIYQWRGDLNHDPIAGALAAIAKAEGRDA